MTTAHALDCWRFDLPQGWRYREKDGLRWVEGTVGEVLDVLALAAPAEALTQAQRDAIQFTRQSYSMWGEDVAREVQWDAFDGLGRGGYDTTHYIINLTDRRTRLRRTVTMRTVRRRMPAAGSSRRGLPFGDMAWWETASEEPLWSRLRPLAHELAPSDRRAEYRFALLGRIAATPPHEGDERRWRVAIAFAVVQLLLAGDLNNLAVLIVLCPELRDRILGVTGRDGIYVAPDFPAAGSVLGLEEGVRLNRQVPAVRDLILRFPGYWTDNDSLARLLVLLLRAKVVRPGDFKEQLWRLFQDLPESQQSEFHRAGFRHNGRPYPPFTYDRRWYYADLAGWLSAPRTARFLPQRWMPDASGAEPKRFSGASAKCIRELVLERTEDGPFLSVYKPIDAAERAQEILRVAEEVCA